MELVMKKMMMMNGGLFPVHQTMHAFLSFWKYQCINALSV